MIVLKLWAKLRRVHFYQVQLCALVVEPSLVLLILFHCSSCVKENELRQELMMPGCVNLWGVPLSVF